MLSSLIRKLPIFAIDEVHVEKVEDDRCWYALCRFLEKHHDVFICLLYEKRYFDNEDVISKYRCLRRFLYPNIGLHVHIAIPPLINSVPYKEQYKVIKSGLDFLREKCEIETRDLTCGWFSFNEDTLKVCRDLNLRLHIWHGQEWKITIPVETKRVKKVIHDWELIGEIR